MEIIKIIVGLIVAYFLVIAVLYNKIIKADKFVHTSFSSIDIYLQKRYDLIPNLVKVVQDFTKHEEKVFVAIADARSKALVSKSLLNETVKINNDIDSDMKSINLLIENYPELQSSQSYLNLQKQLASVENDLVAARRTYNAAVTNYNTLISTVPTNLVANAFKKKEYELFVFVN